MLNVHNIMEEFVIDRVNKLYGQVKEEGAAWLTCDCEKCRTDTVNFVLNRAQPRYVSGGRGITHNAREFSENSQIVIDVEKLCIEGMRLVNNAKRPGHQSERRGSADSDSARFNFPTFVGNVLDGSSFESLPEATALLKMGNEMPAMMDSTWPNPCKTFNSTKGSYSFWVAPIESEKEGETRKFSFSVRVSAEGYEDATVSFTVPLSSERGGGQEPDSIYSVKISDVFLFRKEQEK